MDTLFQHFLKSMQMRGHIAPLEVLPIVLCVIVYVHPAVPSDNLPEFQMSRLLSEAWKHTSLFLS